MDKINIDAMLSNSYISVEDMRTIKVAIDVIEVQAHYSLATIAEGNYTINRADCLASTFVTMLEYAALTRKDYITYGTSTNYDNAKNVTHEKIQHIKHMRAVFPFLGLKFAKEIVEMSEAIDPNKYNYMTGDFQIKEEDRKKDNEALNALRAKLTGEQSEEPPF